ncbi:MAG: hypothetical protein K6V97_06045 [Actinomycetia bacterium]|nr:hypothetical protein [Actinomycetes bacterium]
MERDVVDDTAWPHLADAGRWAEQETVLAGRWVDPDGREVWVTRTIAWAWVTGLLPDPLSVARPVLQQAAPVLAPELK